VSRPCPSARRIAREVLTLPVHSGVSEKHIKSIVEGLKSVE
jgi:dTDP-4-amino-4,6-dideoxygalactose transaminase